MDKTGKFYFSKRHNLNQEDVAALLFIPALLERTGWLLNNWAKYIKSGTEHSAGFRKYQVFRNQVCTLIFFKVFTKFLSQTT